jgi:hypothetical protein
MSEITPYAAIRLSIPHLTYGVVEAKPFTYEVQARNSQQTTDWLLSDLSLDTDAKAVTLSPVYIGTDNDATTWTCDGTAGGAALTFDTGKYLVTDKTMVFQSEGTADVQWSATTVGTSQREWWLDYWLSYPTGTGVSAQATVSFPLAATCAYRVVLTSDAWPILQYTSDSGGTYQAVGEFKQSGSIEKVGFAAWARLMFQRIQNHTVIRIGESVLHHYSSDYGATTAGAIAFAGTSCSAAFGWQPMAYATAGTLTASEVSHGITVGTPGTITVYGGTSADGQTFSGILTDVDSSSFTYSVVLTATAGDSGYAEHSPYVTRLKVHYPSKQIAIQTSPVTTLPYLRSVTEQLHFDPTTLNLFSHITAEFTNTSGAFSEYSGVRACEVDMGYEELGIQRRITGLAGHLMEWQTIDGDQLYCLHIWDRSIMLRAPAGVIAANLPYMDGWCVYRAMRYLANYAGISDTWLSFPLCDGDVYNPCGHYLLPYGDDLNPLVRFTGGMYVWECMRRLQELVGFCLYFDAMGKLQFYAYVPSAPGAYKKAFSLVPEETWLGAPKLNELFAVSRTRDMRQTRNDVTVIGIDPETWKPIVAHDRDTNSIYDPSAANYLGYRAPMVWSDSMFATVDYATQALNALFPVARLPQDTVTLKGWMQHELAPLDVISVDEPISAPGNRPYWIVGITNSIVVDAHALQAQVQPTCTIQAEWLTPWG